MRVEGKREGVAGFVCACCAVVIVCICVVFVVAVIVAAVAVSVFPVRELEHKGIVLQNVS